MEYFNFPASPGATVDGLIDDDYRTFTETGKVTRSTGRSKGRRVHLVSAEAQEEGTCSPGDGAGFRAAVLADFEPSFAAVAQGSHFPAEVRSG